MYSPFRIDFRACRAVTDEAGRYHYLNSYTLYGAENRDNAMAIMKGLYKKYGRGS